jgi:hypothetical protein
VERLSGCWGLAKTFWTAPKPPMLKQTGAFKVTLIRTPSLKIRLHFLMTTKMQLSQNLLFGQLDAADALE